MNILLWIFQVALALLCFAGGAYKLFQFDELAKVPATAALPRAGWGCDRRARDVVRGPADRPSSREMDA
jgi:hypothetical protein